MTAVKEKPRVFVIMPFSKDFDDVYRSGIKAACRESGADCERADELISTQLILGRIYSQITEADLIIADMTGLNANVFYEVGFAHACGKTVILLTRDEDIPFNLQHYPHISYKGKGGIEKLKAELKPRVKRFLGRPEDSAGRVVVPPASKKHGVKLLHSIEEIYDEACDLIRKCTRNELIRTTSLGLSPEAYQVSAAAWKAYIECLASRVGRATQEEHGYMEYWVVMGFRADGNGVPPPNKQRAIKDRRRTFRKHNALDKIKIRSIDTSWVVELGVFGKSHVIIGFPIVADDRELRFGLRITDEDFADKMILWYDRYVWEAARPVTWAGDEEG